MRYRFTILLAWLSAICLLSAQERDSILARMNAVKLDPGYIYGYCALPDADSSRAEALADLAPRVAAFLKEKECQHLHAIGDCPEGTVRFLVYAKGSNYFRTLAYVDKAMLESMEREISNEFEAQGFRMAIDKLKEGLAAIRNYKELGPMIASSPAASFVLRSLLTFDTPQDYVDRSYLLYYDRKTGQVNSLMTPRNAEGIRFDVRTGLPGNPKVAPQGTIECIFFDEPTKL